MHFLARFRSWLRLMKELRSSGPCVMALLTIFAPALASAGEKGDRDAVRAERSTTDLLGWRSQIEVTDVDWAVLTTARGYLERKYPGAKHEFQTLHSPRTRRASIPERAVGLEWNAGFVRQGGRLAACIVASTDEANDPASEVPGIALLLVDKDQNQVVGEADLTHRNGSAGTLSPRDIQLLEIPSFGYTILTSLRMDMWREQRPSYLLAFRWDGTTLHELLRDVVLHRPGVLLMEGRRFALVGIEPHTLCVTCAYWERSQEPLDVFRIPVRWEWDGQTFERHVDLSERARIAMLHLLEWRVEVGLATPAIDKEGLQEAARRVRRALALAEDGKTMASGAADLGMTRGGLHEAFEMCEHWGGEEAFDDERARDILEGSERDCAVAIEQAKKATALFPEDPVVAAIVVDLADYVGSTNAKEMIQDSQARDHLCSLAATYYRDFEEAEVRFRGYFDAWCPPQGAGAPILDYRSLHK